MGKRVVHDPKMRLLIEFFGKDGTKFVDEDGNELVAEEEENE